MPLRTIPWTNDREASLMDAIHSFTKKRNENEIFQPAKVVTMFGDKVYWCGTVLRIDIKTVEAIPMTLPTPADTIPAKT